MRILLIAYEFPPSPSPQSLRWAYLAIELNRLGHEVHVLAPDIAGHGRGGLPELPAEVRVHRSFAGPVMGLVASRSQARQRRQQGAAEAPVAPQPAPTPPEELNWKGRVWHAGLNWKGRAFEQVKRLAAYFTFPDIRGEWEPWGRNALKAALQEVQPDIVLSSHEPATTLRLGLLAQRMGYPWVADLGDPVLAPYTEWRWRLTAYRLERAVSASADLVTVTASKAAELLLGRHGGDPSRVVVLTQGFDDCLCDPGADYAAELFDGRCTELLYTGSFYGFRRADELLAAVLATDGVRLNVASVRVPEELQRAAAAHPDKVRLLGFVPHRDIIRLQRRADLLVNISNDCPTQVPGKLYEYMGACRPILAISTTPNDASQQLVRTLGRGLICDNDRASITRALSDFMARHREGAAGPAFDLRREPVEAFGWGRIAKVLESHLQAVLAKHGASRAGRAAPSLPSDSQERA